MSIPFHHSVAQIVQSLIVTNGLGASYVAGMSGTPTDWSVYASGEPPLPENCITVYGTAPVHFGKTAIDGMQQQHRGVTIRVRGVDEPTATVRAELLMQYLTERVYRQTVELTYQSVVYKYLVNSFPRLSLVPFGYLAPTDKRYVINLNGTVVVRTRV